MFAPHCLSWLLAFPWFAGRGRVLCTCVNSKAQTCCKPFEKRSSCKTLMSSVSGPRTRVYINVSRKNYTLCWNSWRASYMPQAGSIKTIFHYYALSIDNSAWLFLRGSGLDSFCKWVCSDFYLNHSQPVTVRLKIFVTSGMESLCLPPSILRILACTWGLNARNVDMGGDYQ